MNDQDYVCPTCGHVCGSLTEFHQHYLRAHKPSAIYVKTPTGQGALDDRVMAAAMANKGTETR
jgi:hypothetical protein